jgi:xanthine dehydrogenase small subunit
MRNTIRFILGGRLEEIQDCDPTLSVLEFLREHRQRTGTKEGCAEGDCGACTVVLVEIDEDRLVYRAVNSCILFLPVLDGKQLITVEDLHAQDGSLHPVQQALVDQHGSQCGFCTPGFVMSLFAMYHDSGGSASSRADIDTGLAGNLCRCTGYLPIVKAADQSLSGERTDRFLQDEQQVLQQLRALGSDDMLAMTHQGRRYFAPTDLKELCALLKAHPEAILVAGATDVGLWVTKQLQQPETLIYTGKVRELLHIERNLDAGELRIGAAVTYTQALPWIIHDYPEFEELLNRLGAMQVRNAGTIGGNIANGSPIGDMPPALIALRAKLVLASANGERLIALEDYFIEYGRQDLRPGECVARVILPLPVADSEFRTYKLSKRIEQDISAVCAAFHVTFRGGNIEQARICFGGMAATPKRARNCEKSLTGKAWTVQNVDQAMIAMRDDFKPISDMRASAEYRMLTAQNLLKRFFFETSGVEYPVRLATHRNDLQEMAE